MFAFLPHHHTLFNIDHIVQLIDLHFKGTNLLHCIVYIRFIFFVTSFFTNHSIQDTGFEHKPSFDGCFCFNTWYFFWRDGVHSSELQSSNIMLGQSPNSRSLKMFSTFAIWSAKDQTKGTKCFFITFTLKIISNLVTFQFLYLWKKL